jgi:cytochrome c oxidase subunit 2
VTASLLIPPEKLGTPEMSDSPWALLPTASNHAQALDDLYLFITLLCAISMVLVIGAMVYFMFKYRQRGPNDKTDPITHNGRLEFIWSAIPAVFLVVIFVWGELDFMKLSAPPSDAIDIRITGQKWLWTIEYPAHPGGPSLTCPRNAAECPAEEKTPTLIVPLGKPVQLTMTSVDVLHSFYIPAFRTKKDVVPGRYATMWFTPIKEGEFPIFCTEYCGDEHSSMLAKAIVVPPEQYEARVAAATKLERETTETMAAYGQRIFTVMGCPACHTTDGTVKVGPSFKGLWGKQETLADGSRVEIEDNYIRESLMEPNAKLVQGFPPQMPTFQGKLNEEQVTALIEFIKAQQ